MNVFKLMRLSCLTAGLMICFTMSGYADTIAIGATDSGWWAVSGVNGSGSGNYAASSYGANNYFTFDLTGVTGTITGARLRLLNHACPSCGYDSFDPSLTYSTFDVSTDIATLTGGDGLPSVFSDLG